MHHLGRTRNSTARHAISRSSPLKRRSLTQYSFAYTPVASASASAHVHATAKASASAQAWMIYTARPRPAATSPTHVRIHEPLRKRSPAVQLQWVRRVCLAARRKRRARAQGASTTTSTCMRAWLLDRNFTQKFDTIACE